jgi:hypothetical protein
VEHHGTIGASNYSGARIHEAPAVVHLMLTGSDMRLLDDASAWRNG